MNTTQDVENVAYEINTLEYTAQLIPAERTNSWQIGSIAAQNRSEKEMHDLAAAVVDSIHTVTAGELIYSDCTDGRLRQCLLDGADTQVPLREKLVGADTTTAFAMAEMLGDRFYSDPAAPVQQRVSEVVYFLNDHGLVSSTHLSCAGAGSYPAIIENMLQFIKLPSFMARQQQFAPVFDARVFDTMMTQYAKRLATSVYAGYNDSVILQAVEDASGGYAVAQYVDDGRGVHGHVEELIVRLQAVEGATVNSNALAEQTGGRQAFVVNDDRIRRLAELFGRGHDEDYVMAYMAGEAYTDAAHGTLAKLLPTLLIRPQA